MDNNTNDSMYTNDTLSFTSSVYPQLPSSHEIIQHSTETQKEIPPGYRPLNVKDALSYLDQVKQQFNDNDQPEVYSRFLEIMKEFKTEVISTPGVIERVSSLFRGHPSLIMGFNTFLPPGYRIEPTNNPNDPIFVITPDDQPPYENVTSFKNNTSQMPQMPQMPQMQQMQQMPQLPSFNYVVMPQDSSLSQKHSNNTISVPFPPADTFQTENVPVPVVEEPPQQPALLKQREHPENRPPIEFNHAINYVNKIKTRFSHEPEIYKQFLEILQTYQKEQRPIQEVYAQVQVLFNGALDLLDEFKQFLPDNSSAPGSRLGGFNRQSNGASRRGKRPPPGSYSSGYGYSQRKRARTAPFKPVPNAALDKTGTLEELEFFEKCKRIISNKPTYNEFLKILNLFSQELIDAKVLIERVEPFLSKSPEIYEWFKKFVKYEEDDIIFNNPVEKPDIDLKTCKKSGHSYRKLPENFIRPVCSGRGDLEREVLNDDWISHPVYVSETGFVSHKKTQYEEAMYKCEEERYEFDINIEANLHTISLLEPWQEKIQNMSPEDKVSFRLPRDLGGLSTSIFQRVIKKIYDRERGLEVIDALYSDARIGIPVVLKRLKQKDEEWKRSQREWNKVWREIDAKNFAKSLDHQGIHFKTSDRKAMLSKSLLTEIETLYREQRERNNRKIGAVNAPSTRYQFDFAFKHHDIFADANKLILVFMENNMSLSQSDENGIKEFLSNFVAEFFQLQSNTTIEESGDNKVPNDTVMTDAENHGVSIVVSEPRLRSRQSFSFYSNSYFYTFFRLYQMLYARLLKMKDMSLELISKPPVAVALNPVAVSLGNQKEKAVAFTEKDRYTELLKISNFFLIGDMDINEYEDRARSMYGTSAYLVFTIDKLVQTLVKQIHAIITDAKSLDLLSLYRKDREKPETSSRQEAVYRLSSESLMNDENMMRIEFFIPERVLTIQLLGKEDHISDDTFSAEEKWSFYVDQFVQLSVNEKLAGNNREPFLKRNLPSSVGREPPQNVETKSGLELKICMNTYKIFFVDNTEDYFHRKRDSQGLLRDNLRYEEIKGKQNRHLKFRDWLDGECGWKSELESPIENQNVFDKWMIQDMEYIFRNPINKMSTTTKSSTEREKIAGGETMSHPYPLILKGNVTKGFGRGSKELGIPTANLPQEVAEYANEYLETGIHYGWASVGASKDIIYPMVMSYGWNPFYKNTKRSAEVHIIHEFEHDFYDEELRTIVCGYIRQEKNYESIDDLISDIQFDIQVSLNSLQRTNYLLAKQQLSQH